MEKKYKRFINKSICRVRFYLKIIDGEVTKNPSLESWQKSVKCALSEQKAIYRVLDKTALGVKSYMNIPFEECTRIQREVNTCKGIIFCLKKILSKNNG